MVPGNVFTGQQTASAVARSSVSSFTLPGSHAPSAPRTPRLKRLKYARNHSKQCLRCGDAGPYGDRRAISWLVGTWAMFLVNLVYSYRQNFSECNYPVHEGIDKRRRTHPI